MYDFGMSCVGKELAKDAAQNLVGNTVDHQNLLVVFSVIFWSMNLHVITKRSCKN
jgi:hypothetical protein